MKPRRINYLTQEQIRDAIHQSKKTYCWFAEDRYADFDLIVRASSEITPETAREAMARKADLATRRARAKAKATKGSNLTPKESNNLVVDPQSYNVSDVVFRLMTDEHVPLDPLNAGQRSKGKAQTNFPPFKHYITDDSGVLTEVGRSHWEGSLSNGSFSVTHGKLTNKLGKIYMLLAERLGTKGNYRGYTYLDEMRGTAVETMCRYGLKFDESKSDNAFAYLTVCATNAFTRVLNEEKKNRELRDDLLQDAGMTPSMTRQIENETNGGLRKRPAKRQRSKQPAGEAPRTNGKTYLTVGNETLSIAEWAERTGQKSFTIYQRYKKGWPPEACVAPGDRRRT